MLLIDLVSSRSTPSSPRSLEVPQAASRGTVLRVKEALIVRNDATCGAAGNILCLAIHAIDNAKSRRSRMFLSILQIDIAIDGVSLTLQGVFQGIVKVALIPHTLKVTTLRALRPGDWVNLEVDRLARRALTSRPVKIRRESSVALKRKLRFLKTSGF